MKNPKYCPVCGKDICYDESYYVNFDPAVIACTCHTGNSLTIVAVEYEGDWYSPEYFLKDNNNIGIRPISNERDRRTFQVLRYNAMYEEAGFVSQPDKVVRIVWKAGEAIGFYTDNDYFGSNGIGHIFVRKEFRRQGIATNMINTFLTQHPKGEVYILGPNETMLKVLEKMGYFKRYNSEGKFTGRIKYMHAV